VWSGETRYGINFPVGSSHAVIASVALDAPRTLRNSRRLTPVGFVSWVILVVAVGAVVARLLALGGRDIRGRRSGSSRRLLRGISRCFQSFLRAISVDVTADAPAHVQARELIDAIHVLDLSVARLTRHTSVDVARVWEVHVLGKLMNSLPRDGLRVRTHWGALSSDVSILP